MKGSKQENQIEVLDIPLVVIPILRKLKRVNQSILVEGSEEKPVSEKLDKLLGHTVVDGNLRAYNLLKQEDIELQKTACLLVNQHNLDKLK